MKNLWTLMLGLGIFGIFTSVIVDFVGIGDPGFQSTQSLGIQIGILLALVGWGLRFMPQTSDDSRPLVQKALAALDSVLNLPLVVWTLTGFLLVFLVYFITPMFFNEDWRMFYFLRYIPDRYPIGNDVTFNTGAIAAWLKGQNPYDFTGHFYPPLYHLVFAPILLIGFPQTYYLITTLTLIAFAALFIIPFPALRKQKHGAITMLFFLTGLVSYGMQFELERGQFNVIAYLLAALAVYLFQFQPSFRLLAYTLWSVSTHIKLYPGIFVLMLFSNIRDWKTNLKNLALLGLFNIALLFSLGANIFIKFMTAVTYNAGAVKWVFPGNHSLAAFIINIERDGYKQLSKDAILWFRQNGSIVEILLMIVMAACFGLVIWRTLKKQPHLFDADVFMLTTLAGMIIPSISIDYKLELLAPAMAFLLAGRKLPAQRWQKVIFILLVILVTVAYSLTLVPYKYRTGILINAFPMIYIMFLAVTGLNLLNNHYEYDHVPTQ